ncbi:ALP1-like protein isoform X1, partial [Tanacetum coccineum]
VANVLTYQCGYYLVDGIYPKLATLVKTILKPADDDHKRILYKQKQESARKDVERAFGEARHPDDMLRNEEQVLLGLSPDKQSHVALAGPNPEHMQDVFLATNYPKVHESLKHTTKEHVHLENPQSSSRTLSSMKNLEDS